MAKPDDTKPRDNDSITMTVEQLRSILAEARAPEPPGAPSIEEAFEAHRKMMEEARNRPILSWYIAFHSTDTNARGVVMVSASRRHANGRVVNMLSYEYPPGSDRTIVNGGICPLDHIADQNGANTPEFKQWRYEFWKRDLRDLIGSDAKRVNALGPNRPTLEDALADLREWTEHEARQAQKPVDPSAPIPTPEIVSREQKAAATP